MITFFIVSARLFRIWSDLSYKSKNSVKTVSRCFTSICWYKSPSLFPTKHNNQKIPENFKKWLDKAKRIWISCGKFGHNTQKKPQNWHASSMYFLRTFCWRVFRNLSTVHLLGLFRLTPFLLALFLALELLFSQVRQIFIFKD